MCSNTFAQGVRKRVVADSSSLILLQKCGLIHLFMEMYTVIIAESVYDELILPQKPGADELAVLLKDRVEIPSRNHILPGMNLGESCSIHLYMEGHGDFMLLDDKKAAKYCRIRKIPFINSLLLPRILCGAAVIDEVFCALATQRLIENGYYSAAIIAGADAMSMGRLRYFQPG